METDKWKEMMRVLDPINHIDALEKVSKLVIFGANDEFTMFDQTNLFMQKFKGETNLLMLPNADHSMTTSVA